MLLLLNGFVRNQATLEADLASTGAGTTAMQGMAGYGRVLSALIDVGRLPAIAALLPGVELNPKLALVPILNVSLVSKEILTGSYPWGLIGLIFGSSCVYAAAALFVAVRAFQRESVLFRT